MNNELEIFKKKLIYRAGYRGTKEMDILLSSFVNKHIDKLFKNRRTRRKFFNVETNKVDYKPYIYLINKKSMK